jgi:hypothetical protein
MDYYFICGVVELKLYKQEAPPLVMVVESAHKYFLIKLLLLFVQSLVELLCFFVECVVYVLGAYW